MTDSTMTVQWASGWGDENGFASIGAALPEQLAWHRVSDLPLILQSETGYERCLLRSDGLVVVDGHWVKYLTTTGKKRWTARLTSRPGGRSTIVAASDFLVVVGDKEAVGINSNDGAISWRLDYTEVAKRAGWPKCQMFCIGAWSGRVVIDCGWGHALVDIDTGAFCGSVSGRGYGPISVGGMVTFRGTDGHFRPLSLSEPATVWEEVRNVGHLNGMAKVGNVFVVLGDSVCHGWDITSGRRVWSCDIPRKDEDETSRLIVTDDAIYHCASVKCKGGACRIKSLNPVTGKIESEITIVGCIHFYGCGAGEEFLFASMINNAFRLHAVNRMTGAWRIANGPECKMNVIEIPFRVLPDGDRGVWYFCTRGIFYGSYSAAMAAPVSVKKATSDTKKRARK